MNAKAVIVMGVSGCGKSTVGLKIADEMHANFIEGDDLHSESNIAKMKAGIALTDADRVDWLHSIHEAIKADLVQGKSCVVSCSALKHAYRDTIREHISPILFVYLKGSFDLIHSWMMARKHHFMPVSLLQSQFDALEEPGNDEIDAITIQLIPNLNQELENITVELEKRGFITKS